MKRVKSPAYLDWIRGLPCCICGDNTSTEAAHVRYGDRKYAKRPTGMGERPDDRWALPLCGKHHREQHKGDEKWFWFNIDYNPLAIASALQNNAGDSQAAEDIFEAWRELRTGTLATT